jgi:hypothetical protein
VAETYDANMTEVETPTTAPPPDDAGTAPEPRWTGRQKLAFRLLFVIGGGLLLLSVYGNIGLGSLWYITGIWWALAQIGSYLVRGEGVEVVLASGGDQLWMWCMHLGWIVVSLVIVAIWTTLARKRNRPNYRSLAGLLEIFARYGLAISMVYYGVAKAIPTQMGFMQLPAHQLQLTGDTSLFNTLWGFMGASDGYSIVTGLIELAAGLLLLFRKTSLVGAGLAIVATTQVAILDLFYDVPVKIVAWELLVISVALTARYWRPLLAVAFNRGGAQPVAALPVAGAQRTWLRITGYTVKSVATTLILLMVVVQSSVLYYVIHTPRSDLDGTWRATSFTIDGRPAALTDRGPAPWPNLAITLRGDADSEVLKMFSTGYDSVVTQEVSGYTTAWLTEQKGDVLELRKKKDDQPLLLTVRLDGDRLRVSATVDGKRIEGEYERRFMERDRSRIRLIQPDDEWGAPSAEQGN